MTIHGMCRLYRARQRHDCRTCGLPIPLGEPFYHVIYPGLLSSNFYCATCPPEGAPNARKNCREDGLPESAERAWRRKHEAGSTGAEELAGSAVPDTGRQAAADRVQRSEEHTSELQSPKEL